MKKIVGLIPVRLNSSRLYGKALLLLDNLPLVVHTYRRAKMSKKLNEVYICTDSKHIFNEVTKLDCKALITKKHLTGTDRISEALELLKNKYDLYLDIQGDEPLINPMHIDKLIDWHKKNIQFDIVVPSLNILDGDNPNIVKIVKSNDKVLYFSRSKIPYPFKKNNNVYHKHLSIISFKPKALKEFRKFKQGVIEKIEGIELMRALENGMNIGSFNLKGDSFSVDTKDDYIKAKLRMLNDKFRKQY